MSARSKITPLPLLMLAALPMPMGWLVAKAAESADPGEATDFGDEAARSLVYWWQCWPALAAALVALAGFWLARGRPWPRRVEAALLVPAILAGCALPFLVIGSGFEVGPGAWVFLLGVLALIWHLFALLSGEEGYARHLLVPGLFGVAVIYLWQVLVQGFEIPAVLLPPPTGVALSFVDQTAEMWGDFVQTVLRSVVRGYLIGCGAGFVVAILADRIPFLARGLLPFGNLVSALPIVGIAPIMVMWFGFDWQSKAAVVAVMTFFPMLVNTLSGLAESERIQIDLMRSYAAGYWRTLVMLRLPNALPFIFNALKINSTLALIGAIVAEFFGTPIVGMGFRISTAVARMDLGVVWATIVVAALTGSLAYGGIAMVERAVTAWHQSYRRR